METSHAEERWPGYKLVGNDSSKDSSSQVTLEACMPRHSPNHVTLRVPNDEDWITNWFMLFGLSYSFILVRWNVMIPTSLTTNSGRFALSCRTTLKTSTSCSSFIFSQTFAMEQNRPHRISPHLASVKTTVAHLSDLNISSLKWCSLINCICHASLDIAC